MLIQQRENRKGERETERGNTANEKRKWMRKHKREKIGVKRGEKE